MLRRLAILILVSLGLYACTAHDNTEPPAPLTKFTSSVKVEHVWTADAGTGTDGLLLGLTPADDGGTVYAAGHDGRVSAITVADGKFKWKVDTDLPLAGGPRASHGEVVVGASDGTIEALSEDDGHQLWRTNVKSEVIAPAALNAEVVVVRTVDGHLFALSALDGHQLWSVEEDVPKLSLRGTSAPVINGTMVYAGFDTGKLFAFDLDDGHGIWDTQVTVPRGRDELERLADIDGTLALDNSDLYVVTYQGHVSDYAAESGQLLWTRKMSSYTGVSVGSTRVYATDSDSIIWALDRATGAPVWKQDVMRARHLTRPAVFGKLIAVGDLDGYVHFLDAATGKLAARVETASDTITAAPIVAGNTVIVQNDNGNLYAYRLAGRTD